MSPLILDSITLQQFLEVSADDLRGILDEFAIARDRRNPRFDDVAIGSLIRVMDRAGYTRVSELGLEAARAWAARVGVFGG